MNNKIFFSLTIFVFSSVMASEKKDIIAQVRKNNSDVSVYKVSETLKKFSFMPISEIEMIEAEKIRDLHLTVNSDNIAIHGDTDLQHQLDGRYSKVNYKINLKGEFLVELKNQLKNKLSIQLRYQNLSNQIINNSKFFGPKYMIRFMPNIDVNDTYSIAKSVIQKDQKNLVDIVLTEQQVRHIIGEKSYMPYTETILFCSTGLIAFLVYYFNLMTLLQRS
jgi:hypothetical protein